MTGSPPTLRGSFGISFDPARIRLVGATLVLGGEEGVRGLALTVSSTSWSTGGFRRAG